MKNRVFCLVTVVGVLLAVPFARVLAEGTTGSGSSPAVVPGGSGANEKEEKRWHPRIAKAIHALHEAVAHMQKASHDFGGHREAAIQASEAAIKQLHLALEYRENPTGAGSNVVASSVHGHAEKAAGSLTNAPAYQHEMTAHPKIAKAIHELKDAIAYLREAPHDFGGHREAAIRDSETAIAQLQLALEYREVKDANRKPTKP